MSSSYCNSTYGTGYGYGAWCRTCTRLAWRGDFSILVCLFAFVVLWSMRSVLSHDFGYDFSDGSGDCSSSGDGCWCAVRLDRARPSRARRDRTGTLLA